MTPATSEAPIKPAPGPELTLGGTPNRKFGLDPGLVSRIHEAAGSTPPEPPAPAVEPPTPPKPEATKTAPVAPTATVAPKTATPEAKPLEPTKADKEPKGIAQVREAYNRAEARVTELDASWKSTQAERDAARAKAQELEARLLAAETRIQKELEPRVQRLTEVEKMLAEKEDALRIHDYTHTTDWHERYVKPIIEVNEEAAQLLAELRVKGPDGTTEIPATQEHFNYVLAAPSLNEAARRATEVFGDFAASQIVNLRSRLSAAQRRQADGLKKSQLESQEWLKRNQASQLDNQRKLNAAIAERVKAHLPAPAEGDTEAAQAFQEGTQLADLVANGDARMTLEDVAETVAKARARIIGHSVQSVQLKRLTAENEALKTELAQFRSSEPPLEGRTETANGNATAKKDWKSELLTRAVSMARSGR